MDEGTRKEPTPEEDLEIARGALLEGNLRHAAHHIACAVASDPAREEFLELLDTILGAADDPLALAPLETGETYVGTAAVRVRALEMAGEKVAGLELLLSIIGARPALGFEAWAPRLLEDEATAWGVEPEKTRTFLSTLMSAYPGVVVDGDRKRELQRLLFLAGRLYAPRAGDGAIAMGYAALLRKCGQFQEALGVAERAYESEPGWFAAVGVAMAKKALGDVEGAIEAFRRSLTHQPEDLSARLDVADLLCEADRVSEGLVWYEQVLEREPEHEWAYPSSLYAKHFLEPAGDWFERLEAFAAAHPENERAAFLIGNGRKEPYVDFLPVPSEATVNLVSGLVAKQKSFAQGSTFEIGLSALESPCSRIAAAWAFPGVRVSFQVSLQTPDPRLPRGAANLVLWKYRGTTPEPALPEPDPEIARAIAGIAGTEFDLGVWRSRCRTLARLVGSDRAVELARVMCHPPTPAGMDAPPPPDPPASGKLASWTKKLLGRRRTDEPEAPRWTSPVPPWVFVHGVQVAAALTIAAVDEGWSQSVRRRLLVDLARGPLDWSVEAAVVALTEVALEMPDAVDEVRSLFREMVENVPRPGACCYEEALLRGLLRLPGADAEERGRYRGLLRELRS